MSLTSLEDFLRERTNERISRVVVSAALASIRIWQELPYRTSYSSTFNPFGERQKELDVYSNDLFLEFIKGTNEACEIASEEMEKPYTGSGTLHVTMDPLDGSSNVETNNTLGSIFAVYDSKLPCSSERILSSFYFSYGPMLTLTISFGKDVQRFVAVRGGNDYSFFLFDKEVKIKEEGEVYSVGGSRTEWEEKFASFVSKLEQRGMKLRYCGTFVGDFNQILKYGGIFSYPSLRSRPSGKLRLVYEIIPISFIARNAGGYSSNGREDTLNVIPSSLKQTSPIYVGSKSIVKELELFLR